MSRECLAVSHRWFSPAHPDMSGEQMAKIKAHIAKPENVGLKYVWYDFW